MGAPMGGAICKAPFPSSSRTLPLKFPSAFRICAACARNLVLCGAPVSRRRASTCQHKAERLIAGNTKQWKQILRIAKTHTLLPIMALFSLLLPAAHVLMFQLA